jgi:ubiquinone/menaquinone biosynthesis C-methylase UbiE
MAKDNWNPTIYQTNANFVPLLTSDVIKLLDPQPTDIILDLGCGDGILTYELAKLCNKGQVVGVDYSQKMINAAREKTPEELKTNPRVEFYVGDGQDPALFDETTTGSGGLMEALNRLKQPSASSTSSTATSCKEDTTSTSSSGKPFTAVFSNAALHWMKRDSLQVIKNVKKVLRPGGRFVLEMGGHMNVGVVHMALIHALKRRGVKDVEEKVSPWFFPT